MASKKETARVPGRTKLSRRYQLAVDAYRENGGDEIASYLAAYPHSAGWKAETLAKHAKALFSKKQVRLHVDNPPPPKVPSGGKPKKPGVGMGNGLSREEALANTPPPPPTKLTPKVQTIIKEYPTQYKTKFGHPFPSYAGLAMLCGVAEKTLMEWARGHVKAADSTLVSRALEVIKTNQKYEVLTQTFLGEGNATIGKLILTVNHGMVEEKRVEHTGANGAPIQTQNLTIQADMTPEEASRLYLDQLHGVEGGG